MSAMQCHKMKYDQRREPKCEQLGRLTDPGYQEKEHLMKTQYEI
jgi:hypothetical protein